MHMNQLCQLKCYLFHNSIKSKAVPQHTMEAQGGGGIAPTHLTSALDVGVVSVMPWPRFTPGEKTPGTHWIGGWVSPTADLDREARGKFLYPSRGLNLDPPSRPVCNQTPYWLSYPGSSITVYRPLKCVIGIRTHIHATELPIQMLPIPY
jgi:hypothetical protein